MATFLDQVEKMTETTLWWRKHDGEGIFFLNTFLVRDYGDASIRSMSALIQKLTQDNQNKIEITEK